MKIASLDLDGHPEGLGGPRWRHAHTGGQAPDSPLQTPWSDVPMNHLVHPSVPLGYLPTRMSLDMDARFRTVCGRLVNWSTAHAFHGVKRCEVCEQIERRPTSWTRLLFLLGPDF